MKLTTLTLLFPVLLHASSHERAEQFFLCHYEAAQQLYFCHGIPTELSLSVWALESKYGSSHAATQCNNLGGIKSYEGGKKHNKHFATLDDFYQAFAAIFQQPCYKDMQPQTTGEYLEAMEWACCSYHRSKEYSRKINWIIKKFKLKEMGKEITVTWINSKGKKPIIYDKKDFNKNVLAFLKNNPFSDLYILSDFYEACCLFLNLDIKGKTYDSNIRKIRYRLRNMKEAKLIDWRRCGTGFGGETDFGMKSLNSYALYDAWNK